MDRRSTYAEDMEAVCRYKCRLHGIDEENWPLLKGSLAAALDVLNLRWRRFCRDLRGSLPWRRG